MWSALKPQVKRAKNVILFIGDGMGPTTVTAARVLKGQEKGNSGPEESLAWDRFTNVALAKVMVSGGVDENARSPQSNFVV